MRLLTNPLLIRAAALFLCAGVAFAVGAVAIRLLRRGIEEEGTVPVASGAEQSLPVQAYAVIQQLKQQKFVLQNEQQMQRRRTKMSEQITAAIIANLPIGMLFIGPNGLVRQANAAARRILGFASPMGMSVPEVFREMKIFRRDGGEIKTADALNGALHSDLPGDGFEGWYVTPGGEERSLKLTLIPVRAPDGEMLGLACTIADHGEAAALRQAQVLRAEEFAELALELRSSLSTIGEWSEQMKGVDDRRVRGVAEDISAEAKRLERVVRQVLAGREQAKAAHA